MEALRTHRGPLLVPALVIGETELATVDRRDFTAVRPTRSFTLLP